MLVSLTVGKVDAGVTVLLTPDKRLIEFPSILLPPSITSGSIVDIAVSRNCGKEEAQEQSFRALQERIFNSFGASEPTAPVLRCRNATQTSVVLEWDPIELATADLISLSLYRNGQKAGNIPRPLQMHSTKISGLAVDTEYSFHLVLRTTAGTRTSDKVAVRTHKMTDLSGITITTGILPAGARETLAQAVERIGAKMADSVRIDTTHFVTTEGRGAPWEKAVESNIPVVRPEWVEACEKNGRILGVTKFYLDAMRPDSQRTDEASAPATASTHNAKADSLQPPASSASTGPTSEAEIDNESSVVDDDNEAAPAEPASAADAEPSESPYEGLEQDSQSDNAPDDSIGPDAGVAAAADDNNDDDKDEDDDDDKVSKEKAQGDAPNGKPTAPTDGSQFQEVEL